MRIVLPAMGVAVAAFAVWLTVRLVNRRKRLGRRTWITVAAVAVLVGYPLSFGPACWITSRANLSQNLVNVAYQPILWGFDHGPDWLRCRIHDYADFASVGLWHLELARYRSQDITVWTREQPIIGTQLILH